MWIYNASLTRSHKIFLQERWFIMSWLKMRDGWQAQRCLLARQGQQPWPSHCSAQRALPGRSSCTGWHAQGFRLTLLSLSRLLMSSAARTADQCKQTGLLHHVDSVQDDSLTVSKEQIMSSHLTVLSFQSSSSCACVPDGEGSWKMVATFSIFIGIDCGGQDK